MDDLRQRRNERLEKVASLQLSDHHNQTGIHTRVLAILSLHFSPLSQLTSVFHLAENIGTSSLGNHGCHCLRTPLSEIYLVFNIGVLVFSLSSSSSSPASSIDRSVYDSDVFMLVRTCWPFHQLFSLENRIAWQSARSSSLPASSSMSKSRAGRICETFPTIEPRWIQ